MKDSKAALGAEASSAPQTLLSLRARARPEALNPKPEALSPKPSARSPKREARSPKPETLNPKPRNEFALEGVACLQPLGQSREVGKWIWRHWGGFRV